MDFAVGSDSSDEIEIADVNRTVGGRGESFWSEELRVPCDSLAVHAVEGPRGPGPRRYRNQPRGLPKFDERTITSLQHAFRKDRKKVNTVFQKYRIAKIPDCKNIYRIAKIPCCKNLV